MNRLIEIRSYKLKPGTAHEFHNAVASTTVPMLRTWGMDVVAFGPSAHEPDTYFLIRAYNDLADLRSQQDASTVRRHGAKVHASPSCLASKAI